MQQSEFVTNSFGFLVQMHVLQKSGFGVVFSAVPHSNYARLLFSTALLFRAICLNASLLLAG